METIGSDIRCGVPRLRAWARLTDGIGAVKRATFGDMMTRRRSNLHQKAAMIGCMDMADCSNIFSGYLRRQKYLCGRRSGRGATLRTICRSYPAGVTAGAEKPHRRRAISYVTVFCCAITDGYSIAGNVFITMSQLIYSNCVFSFSIRYWEHFIKVSISLFYEGPVIRPSWYSAKLSTILLFRLMEKFQWLMASETD